MKNNSILFTVFIVIGGLTSSSGQKVDMSTFHGMSPRNIGPAGMSGRVTAIDVELDDVDNIFIGTAAGGVWKSENSGHTWFPIFDDELAASIGDVEIYQKNPDIIYVGTGEGNPRNSQNSGWGMYKTIDGGNTWQHLGLENTRQIHRVIIHPDNPNIVVAGVAGATWGDSPHRGIYKSINGGETWEKVLFVNNRTGISDLVVDPKNPNKMIAAMYEHRRWPWFYKSGGEGSGLYITHDGGDTWKEIEREKGLPKGELGRIGLSIAPSNSDYIYAYIESKENAIYRSIDGGVNWVKMSKKGDRNIGGRPFYYADIYVDTQNPNRVYSIASEVTVTDDGGKTWGMFAPGNKIHTDHHAWWSHPTDPKHIMIGHDGGLNTSHDRGENWTFADNLPLAQFYHIRVDNAIPYNVMGGLQDNGSWRGPSQTWFKGGIRNMYWQRLSVGDGFDVVPDPLDNDYGYAMGQAGNLVRWHAPSGHLKKIKPVHPEGEYLRFNWNAGIAINPHDQKTIYYGSQYLHKSSDYGDSWEIISPDLTTDDSEKQKFLESGGLSYDVTGAEFHTTIITIDPSPINQDVIWVGTDDGNVQVTQNGGQNWSNIINNIKGVPQNTWVTQINASSYNEGEAIVVFEDHRRDNWEPYVYQTKDFGRNWKRLIDANDVRGYVFCFAQDPVDPSLMFVGSEFGLYVSFDGGEIWNQWTNDFPTMPVTDMVIHPRDHDLVIGTFGRAIWILDDIRPLRELSRNGVQNSLSQSIELYPIPDAHLMFIGESIGYRQGKIGDALYNGENRPYGAMLTYHIDKVNADLKDFDAKVKIEILDNRENVIRTFYEKAKDGVSRTDWNLRIDAPRQPQVKKPMKPVASRSGFYAAPGTYSVKVSYDGNESNSQLKVIKDPRKHIDDESISAKWELIQTQNELIKRATASVDEVRSIQSNLKLIKDILNANEIVKEDSIFSSISNVEKDVKGLIENALGKEVQGIYRKPEVLTSMIRGTSYLLDHVLSPATDNQRVQQGLLKKTILNYEKDVNDFKNGNLKMLYDQLKDYNLNIFSN